jgi:hypothetical protein
MSKLAWGGEIGLWCLMPLSTIFQLFRGGQFNWWKKPEYPEKTTDLPHVTGHCGILCFSSYQYLRNIIVIS